MTSMLTANNTAAAGAASSGAPVPGDPSTGGAGGLGKYFMIAQGLSAITGLMGGFSGKSSSSDESALLNQQAELALEESRRDAALKREQVLAFKEDQAQGYNSSGVLSTEGSPMAVMADTVRKGNMEIDAITKRGESIANLYRLRAQMTRKSGTFGLLGSVLGTAGTLGAAILLGKKLGMFSGGGGNTGGTEQQIPGRIDPNGGMEPPQQSPMPGYGGS